MKIFCLLIQNLLNIQENWSSLELPHFLGNENKPILKSSIVLYKENICVLWLYLCKFFQSYKHYAYLSSNKPIRKQYADISYILKINWWTKKKKKFWILGLQTREGKQYTIEIILCIYQHNTDDLRLSTLDYGPQGYKNENNIIIFCFQFKSLKTIWYFCN